MTDPEVAALERAALAAFLAAKEAAEAAGPITTTHFCDCEDCEDGHAEVHFAPVADAVWQTFGLLHDLAMARRAGAVLTREGNDLIAVAEAGFNLRLDLTSAEIVAEMVTTLGAIAQAFGQPIPTPYPTPPPTSPTA